MIKQYLILSLLLAVNSATAMEWTITKPDETLEERNTRYNTCLAAFQDVWQKGKKSMYWSHAKQQEYSSVPFTSLIQAIETQNCAQCILHLAQPSTVQQLTKKKKTNILHAAARSGFYPLCQFLVGLERDPSVDFMLPNKKGKTPLDYACDAQHSDVCALLLMHKAGETITHGIPSITKALAVSFGTDASSDELYKLYRSFDSDSNEHFKISPDDLLVHCAHTLTYTKMSSRFPLLMSLKLKKLKNPDLGDTFFHKIISDRSHADETKVDACINILPCYQYMLERDAVRTLLAIQRFRKNDSPIFARIPKDIIRYVIAPLISPLKTQRNLAEAVNAQMQLFERMLQVKDIQSIRALKRLLPAGEYQYYPDLNPETVEQHRGKIAVTTAILWFTPRLSKLKVNYSNNTH